ncbi:MAG: PEP-CTERM sorting domain-containing protein, partial [Thermodesulfovibrionales bacterium]
EGINGDTLFGYYADPSGSRHGFTATLSGETPPPIPEPATGLLLGFGSLIAAGLRKRFKKQ